MTGDLQSYEREGKHTVYIGDLVHVAGNPESRVTNRGWYNAEVRALTVNDDGSVTASVTKPGDAGLRYVAADRLTRQSAPR